MPTLLYDSYRERYPVVLQHLENASRLGRLSHAFLLQADSDRVRQEFATALAQLAACPENREGRPCGVCRVCRGIKERTYQELYTLSPVGKMYEIKIGDRNNPEPNTLRFFEKQFHLTRVLGGRRKVGIIFDADRLNEESQNALLKTLEEPPPETLLVLATGNPAALLPTTRSRCQLLPLFSNRCEYVFPGVEDLVAALNELSGRARGDLAEAEEQAAVICRVASSLSSAASARSAAEWEERVAAAARSGDAAYARLIESQAADAGYGACRKERGMFLSAIHAFAAQLFQLASGVPFEALANPELFPAGAPEGVTLDFAAHILKEADELLFTLRFNVNEELALRAFAVGTAMK